MKGMTGYGRAVRSGERSAIEVAVSSFNKRALDVSVKVSSDLMEMEPFIRKSVSDAFERGSLFVVVRETEGVSQQDLVLDIAEKRLRTIEKITSHLGLKLSDGEIFSALLDGGKESLLFFEKNENEMKEKKELVQQALKEALQQVQEERSKEGEFLFSDLMERIHTILAIREKIVSMQGDPIAAQVERLRALLEPYMTPSMVQDERLLKEAVLFADKMDISEELSRIGHYAEHFKQVLKEEGALGKKLDFVLQELMREFNTLGAKTSTVAITVEVVQAKTELEKMREQVQNVE